MACSNGSFRLDSPAFADGDRIPALHSGEGLNLSPPLHWHGAPNGTASYALVVDDPDAPPGPWVHWVLFNIPATLQRLPAGLERAAQLPNGARHGRCWGVSTFQRLGYQGPLPPGCTVADLTLAMAGHLLATTELTGLYAGTRAAQRKVRQSAAS